MALTRELLTLRDFTGGLNLSSQNQTLRGNESPDALNVDFIGEGGFITRGGFQTQEYAAALDGAYFLDATYYSADVLLLMSGTTLYEWDGSALASTGETLTDAASNRIRAATFGAKTYFANGRASGQIVMSTWNGTSKVQLTNNFNDDYTTPAGGNMPRARYVASHAGFMWVADTVESSLRKSSRVRFSHLQNPGDWAEADYFDVDPFDDGDPITGLMPYGQMLLVFKKSSVYAVFGYDRDTFTLERITNASGVCTCGAMAQSAGIAYWFSTDGQLLAYNGTGVVPVTDALRYWSEDGKIKHGGAHRLMWHDGRLYMRLEAGSGELVSYWLFVYDPAVGRGAITRYSPVVTDLFSWTRLEADGDPLFLFESDENLYRYDGSYTVDTTETGAGVSVASVNAYMRTAWITAGETATKKRWKRPYVTAAADGSATINLEVYHDYDEAQRAKTSDIEILVGTDSVWDTMAWDDDAWAAPSAGEIYEFTRQPSGGASRAIQYLFKSTDNSSRWWVDSVNVPFRRRQVR